jgi:hypothetical protein
MNVILSQFFSGKLFYYYISNTKPLYMLVKAHSSMPYMKSLVTCLNKMVKDGYTEDFRVTRTGLEALKHPKQYNHEEVQLLNSFRFEGVSPDDNAILYIIQTCDGTKGTLIDAYGAYNDPLITEFIKKLKTKHKLSKN